MGKQGIAMVVGIPISIRGRSELHWVKVNGDELRSSHVINTKLSLQILTTYVTTTSSSVNSSSAAIQPTVTHCRGKKTIEGVTI